MCRKSHISPVLYDDTGRLDDMFRSITDRDDQAPGPARWALSNPVTQQFLSRPVAV